MQINSVGSRETRLTTQIAAAAARIAELERKLKNFADATALSVAEQFDKANAAHARAERLEAALSDEMLGEIKRTVPIKPEVANAIFYRLRHEAALSPAPSEGEPVQRDWREDQEHENGNFINRCSKCEEMFFGHKRRVICKACTSPIPSEGGDDAL